MITETLLAFVKTLTQLNSQSSNEKNQLLLYVTIWMNLTKITLSDRSQL